LSLYAIKLLKNNCYTCSLEEINYSKQQFKNNTDRCTIEWYVYVQKNFNRMSSIAKSTGISIWTWIKVDKIDYYKNQ